ncbi:hypothetical protein BDZ91DRAFT_787249 [Kalaharituber pfeilii]|nr:hypothetical protein BDZ91DRAFT_787249 [Kalaharituber pfeilii]
MSLSTLNAKNTWAPHPSLPKDLVPFVAKIVQQLPALHCEEPMDGEAYLRPNIAMDRLQDFAFTKGFAVVTLSGSQKKGRMRFGCIHHGKPRDTRKLDIDDSKVLRKRRTNTNAQQCPWAVTIVLRANVDSGTDIWTLRISNKGHNHPLAPNPLIYTQHKRRNADYQQATGDVVHDRRAGLSYNMSLHIRAAQEENGQNILHRALHDLEVMHSKLQGEQAEIFAKRVQEFSNSLRESLNQSAAPRQLAPAGPASTLPHRNHKGKSARTLTAAEMAERIARKKRARTERVVMLNDTNDSVIASSPAPA